MDKLSKVFSDAGIPEKLKCENNHTFIATDTSFKIVKGFVELSCPECHSVTNIVLKDAGRFMADVLSTKIKLVFAK